MAKHASGDWIINFCDDMHILLKDWDEQLREFIREKQLDSEKCYMIVPRFRVDGAVEHILSKAWIETVGFVTAYQNTDSWLNTVTDTAPEQFTATRRLQWNTPMFDDYSHVEDLKFLFGKSFGGAGIPDEKQWQSEEIQASIKEAADKLFYAFQNGR
jgi:hypothetical protein